MTSLVKDTRSACKSNTTFPIAATGHFFLFCLSFFPPGIFLFISEAENARLFPLPVRTSLHWQVIKLNHVWNLRPHWRQWRTMGKMGTSFINIVASLYSPGHLKVRRQQDKPMGTRLLGREYISWPPIVLWKEGKKREQAFVPKSSVPSLCDRSRSPWQS